MRHCLRSGSFTVINGNTSDVRHLAEHTRLEAAAACVNEDTLDDEQCAFAGYSIAYLHAARVLFQVRVAWAWCCIGGRCQQGAGCWACGGDARSCGRPSFRLSSAHASSGGGGRLSDERVAVVLRWTHTETAAMSSAQMARPALMKTIQPDQLPWLDVGCVNPRRPHTLVGPAAVTPSHVRCSLGAALCASPGNHTHRSCRDDGGGLAYGCHDSSRSKGRRRHVGSTHPAPLAHACGASFLRVRAMDHAAPAALAPGMRRFRDFPGRADRRSRRVPVYSATPTAACDNRPSWVVTLPHGCTRGCQRRNTHRVLGWLCSGGAPSHGVFGAGEAHS